MVGIQINIPEELLQQAKHLAQIKQVPLANLFLQFIQEGMAKKAKPYKGLDALLDLHITAGPTDLAEHMDDYLYGDK
jgi:hypothetical protein